MVLLPDLSPLYGVMTNDATVVLTLIYLLAVRLQWCCAGLLLAKTWPAYWADPERVAEQLARPFFS